MRLRAPSVVVLLALLPAACGFFDELPAGAVVSCRDDADCPRVDRCRAVDHLCVSLADVVDEPPGVVTAFTIAPAAVGPGEPFVLTVATTHLKGCTVDHEVGPVSPNGDVTARPPRAGPLVYTLTCTGAQGPVTRTAPLDVATTYAGDFAVTEATPLATLTGVVRVTGSVILTAATADTLAPLAELAQVDGNLIIDRATALVDVSLPALLHVTGDLRVADDAALEHVQLPALLDVGGELDVRRDPSLVILQAHALTAVGRGLHAGGVDVDLGPGLDGLPSLVTLDLPALATVGGVVEVVATGLTELTLPGLAHVGGSLLLHGDDDLRTVTLSALQDVGHGVFVMREVALESVDAPALTAVRGEPTDHDVVLDWFIATEREFLFPGDLEVIPLYEDGGFHGTGVTHLGLAALTTVAGEFVVGAQLGLTSLHAPSLVSAGGLFLYHDDALTDLQLPSLTRCCERASLYLNDLRALPDLDGLAALTEVVGDLTLDAMPALVDVEGFGGVTAVGGYFYLGDVGAASLAPLAGLTSVGSLYVSPAFRGADLDGLAGLVAVPGLLEIDNPHVASVAGLAGLTDVGDLVIARTAMTTLHGLEGLRVVRHGLTLQDLPLLTDASALAGLTSVGAEEAVGYAEGLAAVDLPRLTALELPALTTLGQGLYVSGDVALTRFALPGVSQLLGGISIIGNDALADLDGLCALRLVNGDLYLRSNLVLTSVDGLALVTGFDYLQVQDNPALPSCAGTALAGQGAADVQTSVVGNLGPATPACPLDPQRCAGPAPDGGVTDAGGQDAGDPAADGGLPDAG